MKTLKTTLGITLSLVVPMAMLCLAFGLEIKEIVFVVVLLLSVVVGLFLLMEQLNRSNHI